MKNKISGWKDVFRFTLSQTLKSRAFIVSFAIFLLLAVVSMPVMSAISGSGQGEESYSITKVYVYDETGIVQKTAMEQTLKAAGWDTEAVLCDPAAYGGAEFEKMLEEIDKSRTEEVILHIFSEDGMENLYFQRSGEGKVSSAELESFGQIVTGCYTGAKYDALGITAEQRELLEAEIITNVSQADLQGNIHVEEDTSISDFEYWFMYALLFIIMMVCMMAGSQVATAIVTEKSSKVVEYLLTSVRPMAIIVGKVLAMLCAVLGEVICFLLVFVVSNHVTEHYISGGESILEKYLTPELLGSLNAGNVILCLLVVALGLIFYATLAGLAGATVSRMEEAGEGLMMFTVAMLIGCYVGIGAAGTLLGAGENAFVMFALLFPLSSPFILPGAILIGKAQSLIIIVSIVLLLVLIVLLFAFVSRVYETLIVHNGNKIGIKQLLKIK